jgi:hypothetical protein
VWAPLAGSLTVITLLATIGSFGVGFGTMTGCTDDYRCTSTGCSPCAATSAWLTVGWVGQALLLLVALLLAVLAWRGVGLRAVRRIALALGGLSVALIIVTTALAMNSY